MDALPFGWEVIRDPKYGTFYIDHIHKRTQYEPPTTEDYAMAATAAAKVNTPLAPTSSCTGQWVPVSNASAEFILPDISSTGRCTPPATNELTDPSQLKGPLVSVTLVKGARGFGFTVMGGMDCPQGGFMQIKHLIPGGPAHMSDCLHVGDVLVKVNSTNVLGYTHTKLVTLFQSIPVGATVVLSVSQSYHLRTDEIDSGPTGSNSTIGDLGSAVINPGQLSFTIGSARDSSFSCSSHTSTATTSPPPPPPPPSLTPPSSVIGELKGQTDGIGDASGSIVAAASSSSSVVTSVGSFRARTTQRPEFIKVFIIKQSTGFGFTLADHPQGQHVKTILDPIRCNRLQVGDVVVEINDQRVKEVPHTEVVQMLKLCPVGVESRLLIQRGVLVTNRTALTPGSPDSSVQYGSLLRPGRMPALRPVNGTSTEDRGSVSSAAIDAPTRASFIMLPGEFLVHLKRHSTGFGFNVVGGAEEHSQVCIGSLVPGGALQLSGVVRTGDHLVSINGTRVIGAKHREVVQLLDQAAHTLGQVTLGLQRTPEQVPTINGNARIPTSNLPPNLQDTVEVVVPRSQKGDGFGFFISNIHPRELTYGVRPSSKSKVECEYVAQLVPGSKADQLGLLSVGDRILAVNRILIAGMPHEKVVRLIRESGNHIVLTIVPSAVSAWASKPSHLASGGGNYVQFPVTLFRGSSGFGFSIRGGQEFNQMPLLVLRIADGGAAQMDGRLKVGDELMEINGYLTIGMSHGRAIEIIQSGGNIMRLIVRRDSRATKPNDSIAMAAHQQQRHVRLRVDQSAFCTVAPTDMKKRSTRQANEHCVFSYHLKEDPVCLMETATAPSMIAANKIATGSSQFAQRLIRLNETQSSKINNRRNSTGFMPSNAVV